MRDLRIVVCMKVVPKPEEICVDPSTHLLERTNVRAEINPPDMNALEMALSLHDRHGGSVNILSMGPPYFASYLRVGLAMGANHAYLLSDRDFAGADTLATTYTLAQGIRKLGSVDVILCGEESSDGATGQVPQGLAEWLDMPQLTLITEMALDLKAGVARGRRTIRGGYEILEVPLPCVISVKTACNEPRFMDFRLKPQAFEQSSLTVWDSEALGVDPDCIGLSGSPTEVTELASASLRDRKRIFLNGTPDDITARLAELIRQITKNHVTPINPL
jgi:electron transfer flavoprotein beta subunit